MMNTEEIKNYCLGKWRAYEDSPFGDVPICYRLNKKIFAQIYPNPHDYKITLKCTPDFGQFYRQDYPGVVVRGYHCPPVQQPYWNTIYLKNFPEDELLNIFPDNYVPDFLDVPDTVSERDLQKSIIRNLKDFILEVSKDFTFIGEEYRVQVGKHDYYIDLLFYHRGLSCLVAFELKIGEFKPEYVDKINLYFEALDREVKKKMKIRV